MTKIYVTILCEKKYICGIYTCLATTKLSKSPVGDIIRFTFKGTLFT